MSGTRVKNLGFMTVGEPTLNDPERNDAVPKSFLYD